MMTVIKINIQNISFLLLNNKRAYKRLRIKIKIKIFWQVEYFFKKKGEGGNHVCFLIDQHMNQI